MSVTNLKRITVPAVQAVKLHRDSAVSALTALTAYDFTMARLLDRAGIDILLVGDSVGSVVQGLATTIPVTLDERVYHCRCVTRGVERALVVGDLPFLSYQCSEPQAVESAGRLLKEGGVAAVKLEGGVVMESTIARIASLDIPVMGHVGLTPQSYHRMGGHKLQGKFSGGTDEVGSRERIIADALAVERAGAFAVVLEGIPPDLAREITQQLTIPTIGIGAGPFCDGQILVSTDLLGMNPDFNPKFVKRFAHLDQEITKAVKAYMGEVRSGEFPKAL